MPWISLEGSWRKNDEFPKIFQKWDNFSIFNEFCKKILFLDYHLAIWRTIEFCWQNFPKFMFLMQDLSPGNNKGYPLVDCLYRHLSRAQSMIFWDICYVNKIEFKNRAMLTLAFTSCFKNRSNLEKNLPLRDNLKSFLV